MSAIPSSPTTTPRRLGAPYNGVLYVTVRSASPEKPLPEIGGTMAAELGSKWADSVVVAVEELTQEGTGRKVVQITHAKVPSVTEQIASRHNWEYSTADIGGRKFDSVSITIITKSSDYSSASYSIGSTLPTTQVGGHGYILADRKSLISGTELEPVFRVDVLNYVKRVVMIDHEFDETFGGDLKTIEKIYYLGEEGFPSAWGLQGGLVRNGKQLSGNWYSVVERDIVPPAFAAGGRSYYTTMDFTWPAVLAALDIDTWSLRDGGHQMYVTPIFSKNEYSGPCKAMVSESFHSMRPVASAIKSMQPLPISMSTPVMDISIGPTLHATQTVSLSVGNDHPKYEPTVGAWTFPSTNYVKWPESLLVSSKVEPMRGGYLKTDITVFAPS